MAIEIPDALEIPFQNADQSPGRLDLLALRSQLAQILTDLPRERPEVRKGIFVLVAALDFQPAHTYGEPVWEMHWQPLSSAVDVAGNVHHAPEALVVDAEIIEQWRERAQAAHHPVLRARFADLAWELAAFRQELAIRPTADSARIAIDGYLDAVEQHRTGDDFDAWNDLGRAVELAARIKDAPRLQRAKQVLFEFRADCETRDPTYAFWKFDEIVWVQRRPLGLDDGERTIVVNALERQLAQRSRIESPALFDPHVSQDAADRLQRWRRLAEEPDEARRAAQKAGAAFEAAAGLAPGLTAVTWLGEQALRYQQIGDQKAVARVEQAIRARAEQAKGEMTRISVPLETTPEELAAWADTAAGDTLDAGLRGFAAAGLVGRSASESSVLKIAEVAPLHAHIPISIMGTDGFTRAIIGSVTEDLDGRTVHHAAQLLSQKGPWLNLIWNRLKEKHSADLDAVTNWLGQSPFFPPPRLRFIHKGLAAWFEGNMLEAVHILVPQVEAALRDMLAALGGAVTRPDRSGTGFHALLLGDIFSHDLFKTHVPEDIRFHLKVLYQDQRGLNVRNDLAHGLAPFELFDLGLGDTWSCTPSSSLGPSAWNDGRLERRADCPVHEKLFGLGGNSSRSCWPCASINSNIQRPTPRPGGSLTP